MTGIDWLKIKDDPSIPIDITEGEFSSAIANYFFRMGCPALGFLGFGHGRAGKPDSSSRSNCERGSGKARKVTIIYDSDAQSNPFVLGAMHGLARKLADLGAIVFLKYLQPEPDGSKLGIDDGLLKYGREWLDAIPSEEFAQEAALRKLSERVYIYVLDYDEIYEWETSVRRDERKFLSNVRNIRFDFVSKAGKVTEDAPAGEHWLKSSDRPELHGYTFEPSKGRITEKGLINRFKGFGIEPIKGDLSLWSLLLAGCGKMRSFPLSVWI